MRGGDQQSNGHSITPEAPRDTLIVPGWHIGRRPGSYVPQEQNAAFAHPEKAGLSPSIP